MDADKSQICQAWLCQVARPVIFEVVCREVRVCGGCGIITMDGEPISPPAMRFLVSTNNWNEIALVVRAIRNLVWNCWRIDNDLLKQFEQSDAGQRCALNFIRLLERRRVPGFVNLLPHIDEGTLGKPNHDNPK